MRVRVRVPVEERSKASAGSPGFVPSVCVPRSASVLSVASRLPPVETLM